MRVGHAEREAVAAELREHYANGRLTLEELHERLDGALAARTRGDLDAIMADLPAVGSPSGTGTGQNTGTRPQGIGPQGIGRRAVAGQAVAAMVWAAIMICVLMGVGFLGAFGFGVSRPFGIVLILAGLAFLRRLLFGRRRRGWACGPRRRRW
jgi:hypothetical protein